MNIAVRPLILLGTALLAVSACDDGETPKAASTPDAAAKWSGYAKECPLLPGQEPGKRNAAPYRSPTLFSVRCQYRTADNKQEKVALSVTVYRAASGGGTAEQLAIAVMEKNRATATATARPAVTGSTAPTASTEPIEDLGDNAFARLVPKRGVRVYVRSANALIQVDYTDPEGGKDALTTATELTRQALTGLA
ncbi:hypothetical protein Q0Z83_016490 [Actinoplanes sichuanensis]|uniref:DUF3558 domain-containing protein n=1 Tax=Actinoplanes sichuanensis TaxID=512349 RepID=A0ABW4A6Y4_9ACTN|nr:hypothetical protein [Actinoplanes sichuanensis]BEL03458.1 hypothetical protein Q0Z83_016490 [Actinoplanes sichuanensis]